jgi:FAD-dependent urate hydroxylase
MERLEVIIVGAGMGGLTAALALRQAGYQVRIFDRVQELAPAGAGVSLWSNGVKVLNRLGLGGAIAAIGGTMDRVTFLDASGGVLTDFSLDPLVRRVGQRPYPVARTDLQQMLLEAVGPESVSLNSNCIGVEQDELGATAHFEGGASARGDLVVGADGTHSVTRSAVLGHATTRRYAGYVNWNGLVDADPGLALPTSWTVYVGKGQRASMMPVGGGRFYFFFDVPLAQGLDNDRGEYRAELSRHFADWAAPVRALIQRLDPARTNRVEIHDIDPLERLVNGRVALLGDAGHSTTPDLGQGGCQAMEDAWVLANFLVTTNVGVEVALQRYAAVRAPRTAEVIL